MGETEGKNTNTQLMSGKILILTDPFLKRKFLKNTGILFIHQISKQCKSAVPKPNESDRK